MSILEELRFSLSDADIAELRRHLRFPNHFQELSDVNPISSPVRMVEPYDFTHAFRVKPGEDGLNLIDLLHARFPFRGALQWSDKVENGEVLINEKLASPTQVLWVNDKITHRNSGVVEPSIPDDIRVIYETENIILVDKPAPVPVHAGGRYNKNTVISVIEERGMAPLYVVHRLDAVTSGLLLLARNAESARELQKLFTSGFIKKGYEAIVSGVPTEESVSISRGIRRKKGFVFECSDDSDAKSALTNFRVLERGEGWARIFCEPVTGRTHQIRLHLKVWGYPIWDDDIYNGIRDLSHKETLQNKGISLVSISLGI